MGLFDCLRRDNGPDKLQVALDDVIAKLNSFNSDILNMNQRVANLSSDYYNGKAAEHAMDVQKSAVLPSGPSGFWNTVEARGAGASVSVRDRYIGSHVYLLTEEDAKGELRERKIDADNVTFAHSMVLFTRHDRLAYGVNANLVVSFELQPGEDLGAALAERSGIPAERTKPSGDRIGKTDQA